MYIGRFCGSRKRPVETAKKKLIATRPGYIDVIMCKSGVLVIV